MRRLRSAIALLIAFVISYAATPQEPAQLEGQVVSPCECRYVPPGPGGIGPGPNFFACIGTADLKATCTELASQCFISGWATWVPAATNFNINSSMGGAISAIAGGSGGPSYFNPTVTYKAPQPEIPWGVVSSDCAGGPAFGAVMQVAHDPFTGTTGSCAVAQGAAIVTLVARSMWTCTPL